MKGVSHLSFLILKHFSLITVLLQRRVDDAPHGSDSGGLGVWSVVQSVPADEWTRVTFRTDKNTMCPTAMFSVFLNIVWFHPSSPLLQLPERQSVFEQNQDPYRDVPDEPRSVFQTWFKARPLMNLSTGKLSWFSYCRWSFIKALFMEMNIMHKELNIYLSISYNLLSFVSLKVCKSVWRLLFEVFQRTEVVILLNFDNHLKMWDIFLRC